MLFAAAVVDLVWFRLDSTDLFLIQHAESILLFAKLYFVFVFNLFWNVAFLSLVMCCVLGRFCLELSFLGMWVC